MHCIPNSNSQAPDSSFVGNSVCAFIYGFEPYFYVEAPHTANPDDCHTVRQYLNVSFVFA